MRTSQMSSQAWGCASQVTNGCFPQPRLQGAPADALRDITFTLVEGDFQVCNQSNPCDTGSTLHDVRFYALK